MVRYIECAREVMVSVDSDFFEQYMIHMQPEEPERDFFHERMLHIAEYDLGLGRVVPAAIMTCEALIELTYYLCWYYSVKKRMQNYYQPKKPFEELEFHDWLGYLKRIRKINLQELLDFNMLVNRWHEKVGELHYIVPDFEEVEDAILEIRQFIARKNDEM